MTSTDPAAMARAWTSMRVLTVLELLQAKRQVTAAELAARLEVSTRTVQRYVARLQDLGVPVTSTRGRGATYRLSPNYRLPPLPLNEEEAFVVALGLNALHHIGLTARAPTVVGAETKLDRTSPTGAWHRSRELSRAFHLEDAPWVAPIDAALIAEIASAIESRRELELTYRDFLGTPSERTVRPLGMLRSGEVWYLAAYCRLRRDERLFRVDRIRSAHMTPATFEAPPDFDVQAFAHRRLANVPARWTSEVWLETTLATLRYDLLPPRADLDEEGGGVVIRCGVNDLETYAARLLALDCRFEVRSPPELVVAFAAIAARAMTVYERRATGSTSTGGS